MGFYGHITNTQRTSMTFDKIYPNRFTMDEQAKTDGIYAGRYVLIEYDRTVDELIFPRVIQFDGFLYAPPPPRTPQEWSEDNSDPDSPTSYLIRLEPLTIGTDMIVDVSEDRKYVKENIIVKCSSKDNYGLVYTEEGDQELRPISKTLYFKTGKANNPKRATYNLLYNYKDNKYQLDQAESRNEKAGCVYFEVDYEDATLSTSADQNYLMNFNVDTTRYGTSRGYDSTVWQKTYANGIAKYVMIAELNSVVPTIDISADAPTLAPMMPHFDKDSTNIYYKLHMQPSWGFRVRAADHLLRVPTLDYSGSKISDGTGINVLAGSHLESYPSDEKVPWVNTILTDGNQYVNEYLMPRESDKHIGVWQTETTDPQISGAIYYNKAGFNKKISTHSAELPRVTPIKDEISLTPTGYSGHLYPTHATDGINQVMPDVNELTVMLPSIGDTVADMWDLIYGSAEINRTSRDTGNGTNERNTVIRWEDAKKVQAKEGLRLVQKNNQLPGYTYDEDAVNTLAGAINTAQDIIGMIITNDYPIDPNDIDTIEQLNEEYIYYDSENGKYYFKKRDYTYTPVDDDFTYEKVNLEDWEKYKDNAWWVDTNNVEKPDYVRENTFRPERKYVQGVKVPGAEEQGKARQFTSTDYEPGKYYLKTSVNYQGNPLVDNITKAPYHVYYISNEARDINKQYWDIKATKYELNPEATYYIPNKFYEGHFIKTTVANEEDFERKIADGVRLFLSAETSDTYGICKIDKELLAGDYNLIGNRSVYYLTLKTCAMTEAEYKNSTGPTRPILFTSSLGGSGTPQNYYVVSRKYELFTDKETLEASPGVYWKLEIEKDRNEYLNADNTLKSIYEKDLDGKEDDVIIEFDRYMYFREVVELILTSTDNVVNIKDAYVVTPESLPENLYQAYKEPLSDGSVEIGFKYITAQSSLIAGAKNYSGIKDLYTLEATELALGYKKEEYYYQITNEADDYYQSILLDNKLKPTHKYEYKRKLTEAEFAAGRLANTDYYTLDITTNNYILYEGNTFEATGVYYISEWASEAREYWTPNMINKRKMTTAEIQKGKQAGVVYYVYNENDNDYEVYTGALSTTGTYYISSLTNAPDFYYANKYYYQNANGEFVLDTSESFTEGREYYKDPQMYIYEDPNGFYSQGAIWPLAQNPPKNSGIVLSKREETWKLEELKGFDVHFNTLHGLILRLNKWMLQGDTETRDDKTLQGALNTLNDLIHRFGQMKPGQLMMVDDTGRMHGVTVDTMQGFRADNFGDQEVEVEQSEANIVGYDDAVSSLTEDYQKKLKKYYDLDGSAQEELDEKYQAGGWSGYEEYLTVSMRLEQNSLIFGEDMWINCEVDADYKNPYIALKHGFTKVKDTVSASDLNISQSDDINLYAPIVDSKGHVVGHNTETVTLPYGFKSIASINNTSENDIVTVFQNAVITAENTQDLFTIQSANKWLRFGSNAETDVLTIAHETHTVSPSYANEDQNTDAKDVLGPVLTDITFDAAGHLNSYEFTSYTLPYGFKTIAVENNDENIEAPELPAELTNVIADTTQDTLKLATQNKWIRLISDANTDTINFAHETHNVGTTTVPNDLNNSQDTDTLTAIGAIGFDKAGHVQTINYWKYTLPFGYKTITDGTNELIAENTQDSLTVNGDSWIKPNLEQGALTYTHINNNFADGFTSSGEHALGNQAPAFGESFNVQKYTLDVTGHIVNKGIESVTLPTNIKPLNVDAGVMLFNLYDGGTLEDALGTLDLTLELTYQEVQNLKSIKISETQQFEYTPEVEEVSHEATAEDVAAGLAAAVGDKVIDVEATPAENLTIQQLFAKVKELETFITQGA